MVDMSGNSSNSSIGKNINSFSARLFNDKNLNIAQTLTAGDGGHISIFVNSKGQKVGSVNLNPNGNVRNVSYNEANGDFASYNDIDANGTIDSEITEKQDNSKNGSDINSLAQKLEGNLNYKIAQTITAGDGGQIYIYVDAKGHEIGSVNKDAAGKVRNVTFDGENDSSSYNDMDVNGTIDNGFVKNVNNGDNENNVTNRANEDNGLGKILGMISKLFNF